MVNNADWLMDINYVNFLRDVGRHFSVNRMLSFDSVKLRLDREQSLSFLEFNYMILQAYDFVELNQALWLPAADGRLRSVGQHRQRHRSRPPHGHAAALRVDHAAADDFLRRQDGQDGERRGLARSGNAQPLRFLAVLAQHRGRRCRPLPEALHRRCRWTRLRGWQRLGGAEINEAKKVLATEITAMLHGRAAAEQAAETARKTFEEGALADTLPSVEISRAADLAAGVGILSLFVKAGLAGSNGEARRHVQGGAVRAQR